MRVAIVVPAWFADEFQVIGGGDRYPHQLARALRAHCEVTFITFGPAYSERVADGLEMVVLPASGRDKSNPIPQLGYFMRRRFDLIHVQQVRCAVTSLLAPLCKVFRIPLVATDLGGGGPALTMRLRIYTLVPRFLLISDFSRSLLPPSTWPRSTVIHGGVEPGLLRYSDAPRKRQALIVGRIMPHKGQNYLIDAIGDDIPLVIAGKVIDKAYHERLRRQAEGRPVTFLLQPPDQRLREEYATAAVTVSASVYTDLDGRHWHNSELLGLTLLESMAVGTPVVCTAVGGMVEYVEDGVTGFVVPPNDPAALRDRILRLLDDPELTARMGRAGRAFAERSSWQKVAEQTFAAYREVARASR